MSRKELPRPGLLAAALAGRITNREGATALHMTPRQFQRLKQRFRVGGALAVRHQGRGRPSHRRLPATVCAQIQALLQDRYAGFNDTHLTEKLCEHHGLPVSRESVRRLRRALGRPAVHRRRPAQHRARRPREPAAGQLLQLDGSAFDWLEGRGPAMTLLGAIDDATSTVVALHFRPTEDLHGYATLLHQVFTTVGLPVALYGDGVNILVRTDRHWSLAEQLAGTQAPTHLGRVLQDLGIGYVQARSPQGKGRVERLWGTLQDRLVSELRLRTVRTRAAANAFLPEFLADFNRRFARPPAQPQADPVEQLEKLAKLKPAFKKDGTVTAGNASGINDGACALLLASAAALNTHRLQPLARIISAAAVGVAPRIMGIGPVPAIHKLLTKIGRRLDEFDRIEINEAFAAQVLACTRSLGLADDADYVNGNGGAIALGHPLGASGARLVMTAAYALRRQQQSRALVSLCVGVGQGVALALERV